MRELHLCNDERIDIIKTGISIILFDISKIAQKTLDKLIFRMKNHSDLLDSKRSSYKKVAHPVDIQVHHF